MGRKSIGKKLRHEILKRDGFRCQHCGRTTKDGIKLHIDHIHPVVLGGTNAPDNLQVLCRDCNLGKSATPDSDNSYLKKVSSPRQWRSRRVAAAPRQVVANVVHNIHANGLQEALDKLDRAKQEQTNDEAAVRLKALDRAKQEQAKLQAQVIDRVRSQAEQDASKIQEQQKLVITGIIASIFLIWTFFCAIQFLGNLLNFNLSNAINWFGYLFGGYAIIAVGAPILILIQRMAKEIYVDFSNHRQEQIDNGQFEKNKQLSELKRQERKEAINQFFANNGVWIFLGVLIITVLSVIIWAIIVTFPSHN